MGIPTFRDLHEPLAQLLRDQGGLAMLLVDLAPLAQVERGFGGAAYQSLRAQIDPLLLELTEQMREVDLLARDEREGDRFLLFLGRRDGESAPFRMLDLRKLTDRIEEFLKPRVLRLTLPYFKDRPDLGFGYGLVLHSPLEGSERQILRLIEEAEVCADLRRRGHQRDLRETLLEIIYNRRLWTAFQPIVEIESRRVMGYEGLSRGPRGTDQEYPTALFGNASRFGLVEELERACRRQAFVDWEVLASPARLFVNTVPATIRDSSFLGRGVLDYLGPNLSPRMVTLEITETQVIENMTLYREAMAPFLEMGFSFAIDDLGAGYSGLESLANLGASYLKIDMGLVRDVHLKRVNQKVVKAIIEMAQGVGATVIAEGIQTLEESDTLVGLGVRFGQGYFYGRPQDPYLTRGQTRPKV
jgi:EAL domain-containing protein (putative c-di-GMP-specific phosphodiesterase class I)